MPPTQEQLDQLANEFWYHLLWDDVASRFGLTPPVDRAEVFNRPDVFLS